MTSRRPILVAALVLLPASLPLLGVRTVVEHNDNEHAKPGFRFANVPVPAIGDAAATARFTIVDGTRDDHGGAIDALHDGKLPVDRDQPAANFFFAPGTDGGRLAVDLGSAIDVAQVDTYSWHPGSRGPQVYTLYAADGTAPGFDGAPRRGTDPAKCGWQQIAAVDTRPKTGGGGGQHGVSIADAAGPLGRFRYLLFDISRTENDDAFGNTFYSEIDVVAAGAPPAAATPAAAAPAAASPTVVHTSDGKYEITIDTTQAPALADWVEHKLTPVLLEWYPKLVAMLPSDGFTAPAKFSVVFQDPGRGVAATGGTRITCAVPWFTKNRDGEAIGAVVHEMVHVVQQYGRARRADPDARPAPGWLTEGIPDYIRWFLYEPQSHGADRVRNAADARYDAGYRTSANFLDYVSSHHGKDLVGKLNAALREGRYTDALWQQYTGKQLAELGQAWRDALVAKAAQPAPAPINVLTAAEQQAGWKLLFNGVDFTGWHSFKHTEVLPGWHVEGGVITCADPHHAGDLCTNEQYGAFELSIEYRIAAGGNSGIMFHVTDAAGATWATGPECQLLDNKDGADPQKSGWLYGLYDTAIDATKPAGEWNVVRLLITPERCEHDMNGVKYFEYVPGSDDFKARVAKSKFARMPKFAQSDSGYLALQGDHGLISFRNIKLRPISAK